MTSIMSFDTETSGLDVRNDQILQFGGVLADESTLEERDRINLRVRRLPYVYPKDEALAVTHQSRDELDDPNRLHEFEAAEEMMKAFASVRGLISWNGPKYDIELIRTTFFRNLHDPFQTSSHWHVDMLPVVRALFAADLGGLVIPRDDDGNAVFRLDRIAPANGIEIDAHDACGDSSGALSLAREIRGMHPDLWNIARQWGQTQTAVARLTKDMQDRESVFVLHTKNRTPEIEPGVIIGTYQKKFLIALQSGWDQIDGELSGADVHRQMVAGKIVSVRGNACAPVFRGSDLPLVGLDAGDLVLSARPSWKIDGAGIVEAYRLWSEGAVNWRKSETIEDSDISDVPENAEKSAEARIYEGFPDATAKIRRDRFRKASSIDERLACLPLGDDRLDEFCVRLMIEWGSDLDRIQSRFSGRRDAFDRGVSSMQSLFDEPAPAAPEPTPAAAQMSFGF